MIYLLNSGSEFIRNNSKVRFVKKAQYRVDKPDYAERAVTEALVNALIHRDYIVLGSEIHIDMFDDRVEITSPGGMFGGGSIGSMAHLARAIVKILYPERPSGHREVFHYFIILICQIQHLKCQRKVCLFPAEPPTYRNAMISISVQLVLGYILSQRIAFAGKQHGIRQVYPRCFEYCLSGT